MRMKRSAVLAAAGCIPLAVLLGGAASAVVVGSPAPAAPSPEAVGETVADTLAGVGLPVDVPALAALPALPGVPDVAAVIVPAVAPVLDVAASAGVPVDDILSAVPLAVPAADLPADPADVVAMIGSTVAGLGLPVDLPALPALPAVTAVPVVDDVVATVTGTLAGVGLPLGGLLGGR